MISAVRIRQVVDVVVTVVMGIAAALIIWRTLAAPSIQPAQARTPIVEDVSAQKLVTSIANTPSRGDPAARVVLIEFSDFECPFCKKHSQETFDRIDRELVATGKVQYAFRHLPLEMHANAVPAAQAAECAAVQGKFWEMRRHLFEHQSELKETVSSPDAHALGLNEVSYQECLRGVTEPKVRDDQAEATRLGAKATPTFLIGLVEGNGTVRVVRKLEGAQPFETYRDAIEQVLDNR